MQNRYRHRIWTVTASRTPYNYQLFAINLLYRSARQVVWSHFVIVAHHLLQNVIYIFHWHAFYRSYCHACLIIGIYTYNDISTAKVIKVIGESTYTVIYASWVPTFLELNAVRFYFLLVKQVVYVYCKCHVIYFTQMFKRLSIVLSKVSLSKSPSIYSFGMDE